MATGKLTSYDLTTGVIVDMDETIYMISPVDSPMISGLASDGLSVLSSRPTNEKKVEWMDEEILTPRSTLAVNVVTADTQITVATGDQLKFSTGDTVVAGNIKEYFKITGYSATTADVLLVTRGYAGGAAATTHATSDTVIGVGTSLAEGADPENARARDRTGRYNVTQIFGPTAVQMSRTEAKVGKYGVSDEWNHQLMNRISENVISRESAYLYGTRYESTTEKVRTLGGLYYYIVNGGGVVDTATTVLTVVSIQSNQQTMYNAGAIADRFMANPAQIKNLTDAGTLTTIHESRDVTERGRMPSSVVWTEFGPISVVRNRWVKTGHAFLFRRENVIRRIFDTLQFEWLAKTGDSKKGQIVCEESLEVKGVQHMSVMSALT